MRPGVFTRSNLALIAVAWVVLSPCFTPAFAARWALPTPSFSSARYLNPNTGRFWTMDTFEGSQTDPLSLHKYLYAADNPVNLIDPSGHESLMSINVSMFIVSQMTLHELRGANGALKGARAMFGGDQFVNDLIHGMDVINIVDEKVGQVMLGVGAVAGGFKIAQWVGRFATGPTAKRIFQGISEMFQHLPRPSPAPDGCFVAGTMVATENGEVRIEEIQPGDQVWSWSETSGEWTLKPVVATMRRHAESIVDVKVQHATISATTEHPFWVKNRGWIRACDLNVGDRLLTFDGDVLVDGVGERAASVDVFNFEVEDTHTYMVGEQSVVVHNRCGVPAAPGIYVIETPNGQRYVGQADNLLKRLLGGGHDHQALIDDPANKLTTFQIDQADWLARGGKSGKQSQDILDEIFIRSMDAHEFDGGLNGRYEINVKDFMNAVGNIGAPKVSQTLTH